MPVNFSDWLNPQWEAGTGRKRKIPYTGVMAGSAVNAPEEAKLNKLTELENERITQISDQFNRDENLRKQALKESEKQAKTGSLIQTAGLGLQGAYLATRPEITGAITGAATKIFGGGVGVPAGIPAEIAMDFAPVGAGAIGAGTEALGAAGTVGYGAEAGISTGVTTGTGTTTGTGIGGTLGAYAAPAGIGLGAGQLALRTGAGKSVAEAIGMGGEHEASSGMGALAGAGAGFAMGGPVGAVIGAIAGLVGGSSIIDDCIIITACTHPQSDEVNLAREYRDRFMNKSMLRGYYHLAERIVPLMKLIPQYNHYIRENLVKYLIDYGNYAMGRTNKCHLKAKIITLDFLAYCEKIGSQFTVYRRINGEVI